MERNYSAFLERKKGNPVARNRYYQGLRFGGKYIIKARDPDAKQVLFGWGSDHDADDMSFYGRQSNMHERVRPDHELWIWTLTERGIGRMIDNIEGHLNDPAYYKGKEKTRGKALLELLLKLRGDAL